MKRKWIRVLALAMTLSMALGVVMLWPLAGSAAEMVDLEKDNLLTISYPAETESNEEFVEDLKNANVVVDVYLIARTEANSGYDGYHFKPFEEPYGVLLDSEDLNGYFRDGVIDMDVLDEAFWQNLVQATARLSLGIVAEEGDEDGNGDSEADTVQKLEPVVQMTAGVKAEELESGLYLLLPHGDGLEHYITTMSDGRIATVAYSEVHGYVFEPMLVSLPTKETYTYDTEAGPVVNTGNPGEWIYDAEVYLKPERMNGELGILKILPVYENSSPATFVFSVKVTSPIGEKIYDDVLSLTFTAAGWKELKIGEFPAGSTFEIEEIYTGSSYERKGEPVIRLEKEDGSIGGIDEEQGPVVIGAARKIVVEFENEYDYRRTGGHGITNHFSYDGDGWVLTQYSDNAEGAEEATVPGYPTPGAGIDTQPENN